MATGTRTGGRQPPRRQRRALPGATAPAPSRSRARPACGGIRQLAAFDLDADGRQRLVALHPRARSDPPRQHDGAELAADARGRSRVGSRRATRHDGVADLAIGGPADVEIFARVQPLHARGQLRSITRRPRSSRRSRRRWLRRSRGTDVRCVTVCCRRPSRGAFTTTRASPSEREDPRTAVAVEAPTSPTAGDVPARRPERMVRARCSRTRTFSGLETGYGQVGAT